MEKIDPADHFTRRLGLWGNLASAVFLFGGAVFTVDTVQSVVNDDPFVPSLLLAACALFLGVVAVRGVRRTRRRLAEVEVE